MRFSIIGLLLGIVTFVSALSAEGSKLLVVIDEDADKTQYSQFWSDLAGMQHWRYEQWRIELTVHIERGFDISYRSPKDTSLSLFQHGVPAYSHLLLLPSKLKALGPALTPNQIVEFVNLGSNVLLALSSKQAVPASISSLLLELDISLPADRTSLVVDHFNYDSKTAVEKHDVLLLPSPSPSKQEVKNFFSVDGLIAFPHAVGQVLGNASPLLASILKAPSTAYIYNPKEDTEGVEDPFATGSQISLVTAFQARNSARFTVLGSAEALQDKWFDANVQLPGSKKAEKSSNKAFAQKVSAWTFKELGVLQVKTIKHYLNEGSQKGIANTTEVAGIDLNPSIYRIKNDVHYEIEVAEWENNHWAPFHPPAGDHLQLEFSMLSPFHRLNLQSKGQTANTTIYQAEFKTPDQHGELIASPRLNSKTNMSQESSTSLSSTDDHFSPTWRRSAQ